jgi:hypothetical protein
MKFAILKMIVFVFLIPVAGCGNSEKQFTQKKLVIARNETAKVKELGLSITNNGCGREWDDGGERPYCDLVIKHKDSTVHAGGDFKPVYIGNIEVTIDKMNPWGRIEDSVPPGGCRVVITRIIDIHR